MPKISEKPLTRLCVRLLREDVEKLEHYVRVGGGPNFNELVRTIIHSYVTNTEALMRESIDRINRETEETKEAAQ